jgi:hypothetical protein
MYLIGKIICTLKRKHVRGKLIDRLDTAPGEQTSTYACPRCGARHVRRVKLKAVQPLEAVKAAG